MPNKLYEESDISAIASAIRSKAGTTNTMTVSQMAGAINGIADAAGGCGSGATEPYIEETLNTSGQLTDAVLHGYTAIRDYAFYGCSNLALTSLPSGVTNIGTYAFYGCSNLALTSLPSGVTNIRDYTFSNCSELALTSLPSGVTSIGKFAFSYCYGLKTLSIPSNPTIIGTSYSNSAFSNCINLTSVTIGGVGKPLDAGKLSTSAFFLCSALTSITVYTTGGATLSTAPFGATNATVTYLSA